ncbi:MAG TPA: hypothetical protein VN956_06600 [Pyrinomonadaceae bacterium]|jgi:hypothetical protein|nr:hypothetical protein [Pyrinomonadaceae bacterium]
MKSALCSSVLKAALLIVPLALCFGGSTVAQAGAELQGYLKVYLVTDGINDGDAWYFPRSSFAIYTIDGKLFKDVKSQHFADDEIPEVVALPVGTYTVVARAKRDGYVHILVVIKEGQQTILDLNLGQKETVRRFQTSDRVTSSSPS